MSLPPKANLVSSFDGGHFRAEGATGAGQDVVTQTGVAVATSPRAVRFFQIMLRVLLYIPSALVALIVLVACELAEKRLGAEASLAILTLQTSIFGLKCLLARSQAPDLGGVPEPVSEDLSGFNEAHLEADQAQEEATRRFQADEAEIERLQASFELERKNLALVANEFARGQLGPIISLWKDTKVDMTRARTLLSVKVEDLTSDEIQENIREIEAEASSLGPKIIAAIQARAEALAEEKEKITAILGENRMARAQAERALGEGAKLSVDVAPMQRLLDVDVQNCTLPEIEKNTAEILDALEALRTQIAAARQEEQERTAARQAERERIAARQAQERERIAARKENGDARIMLQALINQKPLGSAMDMTRFNELAAFGAAPGFGATTDELRADTEKVRAATEELRPLIDAAKREADEMSRMDEEARAASDEKATAIPANATARKRLSSAMGLAQSHGLNTDVADKLLAEELAANSSTETIQCNTASLKAERRCLGAAIVKFQREKLPIILAKNAELRKRIREDEKFQHAESKFLADLKIDMLVLLDTEVENQTFYFVEDQNELFQQAVVVLSASEADGPGLQEHLHKDMLAMNYAVPTHEDSR